MCRGCCRARGCSSAEPLAAPHPAPATAPTALGFARARCPCPQGPAEIPALERPARAGARGTRTNAAARGRGRAGAASSWALRFELREGAPQLRNCAARRPATIDLAAEACGLDRLTYAHAHPAALAL